MQNSGTANKGVRDITCGLFPEACEPFIEPTLTNTFMHRRAKVLARFFPKRERFVCYLFTASGWSSEKHKLKNSLHLVWQDIFVNNELCSAIREQTINYFSSCRGNEYREKFQAMGNGYEKLKLTARDVIAVLHLFKGGKKVSKKKYFSRNFFFKFFYIDNDGDDVYDKGAFPQKRGVAIGWIGMKIVVSSNRGGVGLVLGGNTTTHL
jgi:hypothetical protein